MLTIEWCGDPAESTLLAEFFVRHVDPSYISHGELQVGRAIDPEHWSLDLQRVVADEISAAAGGSEPEKRIAMARIGGSLAALAVVSFHAGFGTPFAILEDLVVDRSLRRKGIGATVLAWIEREARAAGCQSAFLESGLHNHDAHQFFDRNGFRSCSIVMMKSLD